MSTPEENLFIAVIKQATDDALGKFVDPDKFDLEYLRLKYRIENPKIPKKPLKYVPRTFKQSIELNHDIIYARGWFKVAGQDFRDVCDYAGFKWREVRDRVLPIIARVEEMEKKLIAIETKELRRREGRRMRQHYSDMKKLKKLLGDAAMDILMESK